MPERSSVRKLPDEIRAEVDRLLTDGRYTLDHILSHLRSLGCEQISRSALGRYSQQFDAVVQDMRLTREMAQAVGRELSDLVDDDATQLLVGSLQALLLKARMQIASDQAIAPKDVADLARAAKDLQAALRSRAHLHAQARKELAAEVARQTAAAAENIERMASEHGLSAAVAAQLRREVLGVRVPVQG